jgi:dihydroneopterin aldolase
MQNTIFVHNLKITGIHGASAKLIKRVFTINMKITLKNIDLAIEKDDLKETYDYREAVKIAEKNNNRHRRSLN